MWGEEEDESSYVSKIASARLTQSSHSCLGKLPRYPKNVFKKRIFPTTYRYLG